jgi:hypothetical protein
VNAAVLQDRGEGRWAAAIAGVSAQTPASAQVHAHVTNLRRSRRGSRIGAKSIY